MRLLLALVVAAVLPRQALADEPVAGHAEGHFTSKDGLQLYEQSWRPATDPVAVVVLVHGLKDHSARYAGFAADLVAHGYAVHAMDLRGHARSEGPKVYVKSFDEYLDDLGLFLDVVRKAEPGKKIFLFGHSMGGAIVSKYTITRKPDLAGLILSGAALKIGTDISPGLVKITGVLGGILPHLRVMDLNDDLFSRDPQVVADQKADPLVEHRKGPARTAAQLLGTIQFLQAHYADFTVPVLILHGGADKITNPDGSRELYAQATSTDKTLHVYDGLYHDILHEPEHPKVQDDVTSWLDAHTSKAP